MTSGPTDSDEVLSAVRLGWYIAEVRGRNRPNGPTPHEGELPSRVDHALPLRFERTPRESRIEAQATLEALANKLHVNQDSIAPMEIDVRRVDDLARQLNNWRKENNAGAATRTWEQLADLLFKLDAHIQDALTAASDTQACGYQLGRGLSEAYWGLNVEPPPQVPTTPLATGWTFLLGEPRCRELSRLVGRLSAYFSAYTSAAVAGSLTAWSEVASDPSWRTVNEAQTTLYEQHRRWYELIVLVQDPSTLIKPYAAVRNLAALWRAARALWLQLFLAVGSLIALAYFIGFLASGKESELSNGLLGIASAIGISATTVMTRLKNSAQALSTRFRQDVYTDLISLGVAILPKRPGSLAASQRTDFRLRRAVRQRVITTETAPPV
jgi:hypothetical protein